MGALKNHKAGHLIHVYLWLSTVSANERRRYICNVFSQWLRLCSGTDGKVLCAKFQNNWTIRMDEWDFARFEFEKSFIL